MDTLFLIYTFEIFSSNGQIKIEAFHQFTEYVTINVNHF